MVRRLVLKLFITLPGLLPALGWARSRPVCPPVPDLAYPKRECALILKLQESHIAGFQYYQGEQAWTQLRIDDPLTMIREPGNPHDKRAVAVYWSRHKLGYLPRRENHAAAQLLDRGFPLQGRILELRNTEYPWGRVKVALETETPAYTGAARPGNPGRIF